LAGPVEPFRRGLERVGFVCVLVLLGDGSQSVAVNLPVIVFHFAPEFALQPPDERRARRVVLGRCGDFRAEHKDALPVPKGRDQVGPKALFHRAPASAKTYRNKCEWPISEPVYSIALGCGM